MKRNNIVKMSTCEDAAKAHKEMFSNVSYCSIDWDRLWPILSYRCPPEKPKISINNECADCLLCWKAYLTGEEEMKPIEEKQRCKFDECWVGRCKNEAGPDGYCEKHSGQKCWCGKQATHNCAVASSFVCGAPLCDEHECRHVAHGMTGSEGFKHSEKGYAQYQKWLEEKK